MIRSMTGYNSVRDTVGEATVSLEIKTLNHKSFDLHFHSSRQLSMLEVPLREYVNSFIRRGRIEIYLRSNRSLAAQEKIEPNPEAARMFIDAADRLANELNISYTPSMEYLLRVEGILDIQETQISTEECWGLVKSLIDNNLQGLIAMKTDEGRRLEEELHTLLNTIETSAIQIAEKRGQVIEEYREKMVTRISEWKETLDLEPNRVLQEVAFYTDRSDVKEETVRIQGHIDQFRDILQENHNESEYRAVGRRLDFLCQELFRETNTIGSKSSSIEITRLVLDIKGTIEQLREQVQNVE